MLVSFDCYPAATGNKTATASCSHILKDSPLYNAHGQQNPPFAMAKIGQFPIEHFVAQLNLAVYLSRRE